MPTSTTLLIAYSKDLIRAGLRAMLEKTSITIVAEANDAAQTLTLTKKHKPAVVLLDAAIAGGDSFELVKNLTKALPATKFILLSAIDNPTYMARAKAVGAANFLLQSVTQKELVAAIRTAAAGKRAMDTGPFTKIAASMEGQGQGTVETGLTRREEQVLRHVAFGLSNEEIAGSLEISVETVKEHVANILRKLAVKDRTHAAVRALQTGLA